VSRLDLDIKSKLFAQLSSPWKAATSMWAMDPQQDGWRYAKDIDLETPWVTGRAEAITALTRDAPRGRVKDIEGLILYQWNDSSTIALRRLMTLDTKAAFDQLNDTDDTFGINRDPLYVTAALLGLPARCDDPIRGFLRSTASDGDRDSERHSAWFGALLRTGCQLPTSTFFDQLPRNSLMLDKRLDWIAQFATHGVPGGFCGRLQQDILQQITILRPQKKGETTAFFHSSLLLWGDVKTAMAFCPEAVPQDISGLLVSPYSTVRVIATEGLVRRQRSNIRWLLATHGTDPWVLAALVGQGWFDSGILANTFLPLAPAIAVAHSELPHTKDVKGRQMYVATEFNVRDVLEVLLRNIRRHHIVAAIPLLRRVVTTFEEAEIRIEAVRTLRELAQSGPERTDEFIAESGHNDPALHGIDLSNASIGTMIFAGDTKWWLIRHEPSAQASFLSSLGADPSDAAFALGRVHLPQAIMTGLRRLLTTDDMRAKAAAILAMRGAKRDLATLLCSSDVNVRGVTANYAVYNPNLPAELEQLRCTDFGMSAVWYLRGQLKLLNEILAVPSVSDPWRHAMLLNLLRAGRADVSPGLSLLVQDYIDKDIGGSAYLGENIDLDHLMSRDRISGSRFFCSMR
jgi:hypothetical protein